MVTCQGKGSKIHHLELFFKNFIITQFMIQHGIRILDRIFVVYTIDLGGFQHHVGFDFDPAQTGRRIGSKEGVASTGREDHHFACTQLADGFGPDVGVTDPLQGDGRHQTGIHISTMQGITHGQTVHHGCQHTHVVAHHAVHARFGKTGTTEQVAATDDQTDLNTQLNQLLDLLGHPIQHRRINAETLGALQGFTTQLQKNTSVCRFGIGTHVTDSWSYKDRDISRGLGKRKNRFD